MNNIKVNIAATAAIPLFVAAIIAAAFIGIGSVSADGNDSPDACLGTNANVLGSQEGTDDEVEVDVGEGNEVDGVCIKSGKDSFEDEKHSDVLGDGTYEDGCYTVSGVGTQTVTVTRNDEGSDCKEISHIDVLFSKIDDNGDDDDDEDDDDDGVVLGDDDQVDEPVGAVSAGGGGGAATSVAAVASLVGSLAVVGFGAHRLKQLN